MGRAGHPGGAKGQSAWAGSAHLWGPDSRPGPSPGPQGGTEEAAPYPYMESWLRRPALISVTLATVVDEREPRPKQARAGRVAPRGDEPIVYIVDDDEAVRESTADLLSSVGLRVECFATAEEFEEPARRCAGMPHPYALRVQVARWPWRT